MIAIHEAWRAKVLGPNHWARNIFAGLMVSVVALPLSMAFAIASGAKPEQGLYTSIVAGLCVSLFGGSRLQITGPSGAFIAILASITAKYGIEGLQVATLMAGVMLMALGMLRLGSIIKFIPDPVIAGFTAGIGVIIFVSQWQSFLGLPPVTAAHFHERLIGLINVFPQFHSATGMISIFSLAIVVAVPRFAWTKRIPGPLVAMVAATALYGIFQFEGVATIGTAFGGIPQGLPLPKMPDMTPDRLIQLMAPAFTIAMMGAIASLLSAVVADGIAGTKHNSNQELIGQGIANVLTPIFGGFAATGAIARTVTNVRSGGTSPLSGIFHSFFLMIVVVALAPMAKNVPLAALAAILFHVAWNMANVPHVIKMARRAPPADVAVLTITFTLTVFVDLVVAVNIGVILAMLQFMRRMSSSVEVQEMTHESIRAEFNGKPQKLPPGVLVYTIEGPLFFGAAENFERALARTHADPKTLIIRLARVPFMDITGLQTLEEVIGKFSARGVSVILSEANQRITAKFKRAGLQTPLAESFAQALTWSAADSATKSSPPKPAKRPE